MDEVVAAIRSELRRAANPDRAPQMQAYMKSEMPFLGVPVPESRRIARSAEREDPPSSFAALQVRVRTLWDEAAFREERYAASALLDTVAARRLRSPELLPLLRELIVSGAWWDHVDELAHRVGELLRTFPDDLAPELRAWSVDDCRWLRRVAIIAQLGAKAATDRDLLTATIEANAADPDFFLRKAIGWALRDYARTDPDWVRRFVASHELSPLSRREATKHL